MIEALNDALARKLSLLKMPIRRLRQEDRDMIYDWKRQVKMFSVCPFSLVCPAFLMTFSYFLVRHYDRAKRNDHSLLTSALLQISWRRLHNQDWRTEEGRGIRKIRITIYRRRKHRRKKKRGIFECSGASLMDCAHSRSQIQEIIFLWIT